MTFGQSPNVDDLPLGEAWQEIESALEELSRLARTDIAAAELHSRLLERLVGLLAAVGGLVWKREAGGALTVECQMNLGQALDGDANELARHRRLAEGVAANGQPRMVPAAYRDGDVANASPWLAILCPIVVESRPVAVVEIFQRPESRSVALDGYMRLVHTACEVAGDYHRTQALKESKRRERELVDLVEFVQRIHQRLDLRAVAGAIANESRRVIGCDRVTVLDNRGSKARVIAISGVESFDRRSGVVQGLEALARMVLPAGQPLWLPDQSDDLPPNVAQQVQSLLDESHAKGMGLVPLLIGAEGAEVPIGLLAVEQFSSGFETEKQQQALLVAGASGPAMVNATTYDRIPLRGIMQWLAAVIGLAPGQKFSPALVATIALAIIGLALWLIPAEFTVEARGEAMPQRRQHVFAPSEGIVVELPRGDGEAVQQGQLLAKLHSPALDIEESELVGKARTVQEELVATETAALRSELDQLAAQSRGQHSARVLQLKEELRGLESQLQLVRQQQTALAVKSPLDGIVVTWDVQRQLAGRPVKRGDSLLTVADVGGPWELLLDLPDRSAGHVLAAKKNREALQVSFQLGTQPGIIGRGTVANISPATQLSDESQPAVRVTVELKDTPVASFRPGATVVARIHCGRRSLGFVWMHELWEAIRLRLFL